MHIDQYETGPISERSNGVLGVKRDDLIHHLPSLSSDGQLWNRVSNSSYLADVEKRIQYGDFTTYEFDDVDVLPPVDQPSKIVNVGLNYEGHVTEAGCRSARQTAPLREGTVCDHWT